MTTDTVRPGNRSAGAALLAKRLLALVGSTQGKIATAGVVAAVVAAVVKKRRERAKAHRALMASLSEDEKKALSLRRKNRVAVNSEFFRRLQYLLRIVLPGWRSKEAMLLLLHSSFLVVRTFLSLYVASLDGAIVKSIVEREGRQFLWELTKWIGIAIPATYINSMIRFLESKLALAFRSRLVEHVYRVYMNNETYYRIGNLDGRIANADQCMTEDVSRFCNHLAHLYSHLSKPFLDVLLMTGQLLRLGVQTAGAKSTFGPIGIAAIAVGCTAQILQLTSPPFGKLVADQASRDGHLRYVHSRLITHAEEIAFYGGDKIEMGYLAKAYQALVSQINLIYRERILYVMLEQFLMKYVWSASGMCMIAIPALASKAMLEQQAAAAAAAGAGGAAAAAASKPSSVQGFGETAGERTEKFMTARSLLSTAADAVERIMSSYKEVTELAGYTARVHEMVSVFKDVESGHFERKSLDVEHADPILQGTGTVIESHDDLVKLDNIPVVTPNGDVLVRSLSFEIRPHMHLLITGPNGCGKSSTFRLLGGLWPIYGGTLTRPKRSNMFYIPQRPYLSLGNLREQVIYPDTVEDMRAKGRTDEFLEGVLNVVNLGYVVKREGGWDAINDWHDVLSGGEKQRIGMARLFYHKPSYALLDECTSAVSIDVEGQMYQHAKDIGITLLTVTHRPSLWKFHTHLLQFDGEGGYKFSELDATARFSLKEEKSQLEAQLSGIPKAQSRLRELCQLLGEDSVLLEGGGARPHSSAAVVSSIPSSAADDEVDATGHSESTEATTKNGKQKSGRSRAGK
ncbi:hypothetical protein, variant [Capsaspora owczarzaki ATCC 30864]|uniref:Uncharacterized protein n=1 Tax=Capsaspora owczarzaki (strain ATCC 30864) TaxID=595528 RepID=A0A0D2WIX0_CAPO3|nr:hypothetical protein, variant [Capsaspora owczarzaki ATCC 30864]